MHKSSRMMLVLNILFSTFFFFFNFLENAAGNKVVTKILTGLCRAWLCFQDVLFTVPGVTAEYLCFYRLSGLQRCKMNQDNWEFMLLS